MNPYAIKKSQGDLFGLSYKSLIQSSNPGHPVSLACCIDLGYSLQCSGLNVMDTADIIIPIR
jgi:hypothetical protein